MRNALLLTLLFLAPGIPALAATDDDPTVKVLVAYHSVKGHTRAMAEAVAEGARSIAGAEVRLKTVQDATTEDLLWADAIAVGSPVYNANVTPEVQSFINRWPFRNAPMKDKLGVAFASAGGISAGEETVQLSILRSMLAFGMVVAGGPAWRSAFGASAVTEEDPFTPGAVAEQFLEKGRRLGRRAAELGLRLRTSTAAEGAAPQPSPPPPLPEGE